MHQILFHVCTNTSFTFTVLTSNLGCIDSEISLTADFPESVLSSALENTIQIHLKLSDGHVYRTPYRRLMFHISECTLYTAGEF